MILTSNAMSLIPLFLSAPTSKEDVCSALTVLASSSGVTAERQAFMDLVKHEINRINSQHAGKGSLSMVFRSGGITVSLWRLPA